MALTPVVKASTIKKKLDKIRPDVMEYFIAIFNKKIKKGEYHINNALDKFQDLNDAEFEAAVTHFKKSGWFLTRDEDNYQTTQYGVEAKII